MAVADIKVDGAIVAVYAWTKQRNCIGKCLLLGQFLQQSAAKIPFLIRSSLAVLETLQVSLFQRTQAGEHRRYPATAS